MDKTTIIYTINSKLKQASFSSAKTVNELKIFLSLLEQINLDSFDLVHENKRLSTTTKLSDLRTNGKLHCSILITTLPKVQDTISKSIVKSPKGNLFERHVALTKQNFIILKVTAVLNKAAFFNFINEWLLSNMLKVDYLNVPTAGSNLTLLFDSEVVN